MRHTSLLLAEALHTFLCRGHDYDCGSGEKLDPEEVDIDFKCEALVSSLIRSSVTAGLTGIFLFAMEGSFLVTCKML